MKAEIVVCWIRALQRKNNGAQRIARTAFVCFCVRAFFVVVRFLALLLLVVVMVVVLLLLFALHFICLFV